MVLPELLFTSHSECPPPRVLDYPQVRPIDASGSSITWGGVAKWSQQVAEEFDPGDAGGEHIHVAPPPRQEDHDSHSPVIPSRPVSQHSGRPGSQYSVYRPRSQYSTRPPSQYSNRSHLNDAEAVARGYLHAPPPPLPGRSSPILERQGIVSRPTCVPRLARIRARERLGSPVAIVKRRRMSTSDLRTLEPLVREIAHHCPSTFWVFREIAGRDLLLPPSISHLLGVSIPRDLHCFRVLTERIPSGDTTQRTRPNPGTNGVQSVSSPAAYLLLLL